MEEKEERGSERTNNEREKRECVRKKKRESENVTERERERELDALGKFCLRIV